ncbi:Zinc-finger homeodomain protein [Actinidia chinensis var. chinensis]|uniref:Zinc-finger homeodomain protein n=1 Tax=Actinidia chinensis var. chinensis TaxID=1590841 RepID=A0A2R6S2J8_ACTCC|nr:Zinc-finger homeodomain protein [Actinidia chinensis var. chinensis]
MILGKLVEEKSSSFEDQRGIIEEIKLYIYIYLYLYMEIRGQEKDMGMPMGYSTTNLSQPHQDSSSKMFAASMATDRRRNDTLDHHYPNQQIDLKQLQQQQNTPMEAINQSQDLDPDPAAIASVTIGTTSNSKTPTPPPPEPTTLAATITYKECLKNHAANMGGHVVDGCGEFMPGGEDGTPEALRCAACDCHRNFHRREVEGEPHPVTNSHYHYNHSRNNIHRATTQLVPPLLPPPPPPHHHHRYSSHGPIPPVMMAFGGASGAPAESSSEDLSMFHANIGAQAMGQPPFSPSKKRFRTKFTQGQKDKMQEFAERLEWKMQKHDEQQVEQFCAEVGVKRQVFKVWMHNNKQAMKKKQL